jgi:hypothetical protein
MTILSTGGVNGSDTVTVDGGNETEVGNVGSPISALTLSEVVSASQTNTYTVSATVTLNASGQLVWSGTETISGASYTLTYTLTKA